MATLIKKITVCAHHIFHNLKPRKYWNVGIPDKKLVRHR
jgi:hypothetical protein